MEVLVELVRHNFVNDRSHHLTIVSLARLAQSQVVKDSSDAAAARNDAGEEHDEYDVGSECAYEEEEHEDCEDDPVVP